MPGTFTNVTMGRGVLSVGPVGGSLLPVGYLQDTVEFEYEKTPEMFYDDVPETLQGAVVKIFKCTLKAPMAEITVPNVGLMLGGDNVYTNSGGTHTVSAPEPYTFTTPFYAAIQSFQIPGATPASIVIKDSTNTTTYSATTDYLIDTGSSTVYRLPSGTIPASATVHITSGTYVTIASQQINFGGDTSIGTVEVDFTHTSPVTGLIKRVHLYRAISSGKIMIPFGNKWQLSTVQFDGTPSTTVTDPNTGRPVMGYFLDQAA